MPRVVRHPVTGTASVVAALVLGVAGLAGCGSGPVAQAADDGRVQVVAALYPLAWLAEEVGGTGVAVQDLTPPGGEPHDLELSARDVAAVHEADLVVHLAGFQPAIDEAAGGAAGTVWDVGEAADLMAVGEGAGDHDGGDPDQGQDHDHELSGDADPHFWLDPTRMAAVAERLGAVLAGVDRAGASGYRARAAGVARRLRPLDRDLAASFGGCRDRHLVTAHDAFGYLATAYGFRDVSIAGISPDAEPPPRTMARLVDEVRATGARTVYVERNGASDVAETIAEEAGASVAELDPLETLDGSSTGDDYLEVMRANRSTLVAGQRC